MSKSSYNSIKKIQVQKYFKYIALNQFNNLEKLMNINVKLYDGKIVFSNRSNVLKFTKKIFNKKKFKFTNKIIINEKNSKIVFSRFDLYLNKKKFRIIDEFIFDKKNKILKIIVYKF